MVAEYGRNGGVPSQDGGSFARILVIFFGWRGLRPLGGEMRPQMPWCPFMGPCHPGECHFAGSDEIPLDLPTHFGHNHSCTRVRVRMSGVMG